MPIVNIMKHERIMTLASRIEANCHRCSAFKKHVNEIGTRSIVITESSKASYSGTWILDENLVIFLVARAMAVRIQRSRV